jgi:hypothetical protein
VAPSVNRQFEHCPKRPDLPRHKKAQGSFDSFEAFYICVAASFAASFKKVKPDLKSP